MKPKPHQQEEVKQHFAAMRLPGNEVRGISIINPLRSKI